MLFKNYFDEKTTKEGDFNRYFRGILTRPQVEVAVKEIVGEKQIFQPDPNVLLDSVKSIDHLINKFLYRGGKTKRMEIKPIFSKLISLKYTIGYLFYLKGYTMIEDDYEPATFFLPLGQVY